MRTWNRTAVVVTPKQRFLDWLHAVDATSADLTLVELLREPTVYLLPESASDEQAAEFLAEACGEIFKEQLNAWYRVPSAWPQDREIENFKRWFSYSFHSMMIDLCDEPLIAENLLLMQPGTDRSDFVCRG